MFARPILLGFSEAVDFAVEVQAPVQDRSQALGGALPSFLEKYFLEEVGAFFRNLRYAMAFLVKHMHFQREKSRPLMTRCWSLQHKMLEFANR